MLVTTTKPMKVLLALVAAAALPVATGGYDTRVPDYCAGAKGTGLDRKVATTLINRHVHSSSVSQSEKRMVTAPPPSRAAAPHVPATMFPPPSRRRH